MDSTVSDDIPPESQNTLRDPSKLIFQTERTRRFILAAYWVVILLALPLWWYTTAVERLSLPSSRVFAQSVKELRFPVHVRLDTKRSGGNFTSELQLLLKEKSLHAPEKWKGLDVHVCGPADQTDGPGTYTILFTNGTAKVEDRTLSIPWRADQSIFPVADVLSSLLVPYSAPSEQGYRVAQYSPRYRLAFTLLNEDAAAGRAAINWDVAGAIAHHITPILKRLSLLHNFTIESQLQFHAPLAFKPQPIEGEAYGLTPEDLTVFINSAEWTLSSSVSNDPVLHFVLFVPSATRRPLLILDANGVPSSSNAFLLPQWGGIVFFNPDTDTTTHTSLSSSSLDSIFTSFSNQLLILLGVPPLPVRLQTTNPITGWQFDALTRRRTLENAKGSQDTLTSIVRLVDQIENMPVGTHVKGDVLGALEALDKLYVVAASSPTVALHYAAEALSLASRAFFNPGMLALLYFPAEHKYAVYAPLFASAVIPLLGAVLREIAAWRRERRKPREKTD